MIRRAKEEDIKKIYELGSTYNPNFLKTYNISDYLINDKYIILVDEENEINGFLIIYKNIDFFELEMIVIEESQRRKGIANNLLEHFFNNYGTIGDVIFLEVALDNIGAFNLYKKNGFEVISTRKKYYNGVDALVMKKVI